MRRASPPNTVSFPHFMPAKRINVAIVGLGFGAEFIPIYQRHPQARMYAICQRTPEKLHAVGDAFDVGKRYTKFEDLLKDPAVTKVHAQIDDREGQRLLTAMPGAVVHVNQQPMQSHVLRNGDQLQIGNTVIAYSERAAPA